MDGRLKVISEESKNLNEERNRIENIKNKTEEDLEKLKNIDEQLKSLSEKLNNWAQEYNNANQSADKKELEEKSLRERFDEKKLQIEKIKYLSKSMQPKIEGKDKQRKNEILEKLGFIKTNTVEGKDIMIHPSLVGKYYDLVKEHKVLTEQLKNEYYQTRNNKTSETQIQKLEEQKNEPPKLEEPKNEPPKPAKSNIDNRREIEKINSKISKLEQLFGSVETIGEIKAKINELETEKSKNVKELNEQMKVIETAIKNNKNDEKLLGDLEKLITTKKELQSLVDKKVANYEELINLKIIKETYHKIQDEAINKFERYNSDDLKSAIDEFVVNHNLTETLDKYQNSEKIKTELKEDIYNNSKTKK